jgi:hypothetical protein
MDEIFAEKGGQLFGGFRLFFCGLMFCIENMKADMSFDNLRHETLHRTMRRYKCLQYGTGIFFFAESFFNCMQLPVDAAYAMEEFFLRKLYES